MKSNAFNFINGVVTCLLHYRGKQVKDKYNSLIKEVQNPNSTNTDLVIDRKEADEWFQKCLPFTPDTIMNRKLLLKSEDELMATKMLDNSRYVIMHYDIGRQMRMFHKVGYRKNEIDFIKKQAVRIQKWVFAIAEFNVVLSYRTIDEQGFVLIAELMPEENRFDKAMRIAQVVYEYLGIVSGDKYIHFVPESLAGFSNDVCPMSFDENYLFGLLDENGKFFGSFDCFKLEGSAEDVLSKYEIQKRADFREETLSFRYSAEMEWFEEKKYDVVETKGLNILIKGGVKPESEWVLPKRQLTFTQDGIKIIYNDADVDNSEESRQIDTAQIEALQSTFGDEPNIFTIIDKEGKFEPCNLLKLSHLCEVEYKGKGMIDTPLVCFGGYKQKETGLFVGNRYVLLRIKDVKDKLQMVKYLMQDKSFKSMKFVLFFTCQEDTCDLCVVVQDTNKTKAKYEKLWLKYSEKLNGELGLIVDTSTSKEDCLVSLPDSEETWLVN